MRISSLSGSPRSPHSCNRNAYLSSSQRRRQGAESPDLLGAPPRTRAHPSSPLVFWPSATLLPAHPLYCSVLCCRHIHIHIHRRYYCCHCTLVARHSLIHYCFSFPCLLPYPFYSRPRPIASNTARADRSQEGLRSCSARPCLFHASAKPEPPASLRTRRDPPSPAASCCTSQLSLPTDEHTNNHPPLHHHHRLSHPRRSLSDTRRPPLPLRPHCCHHHHPHPSAAAYRADIPTPRPHQPPQQPRRSSRSPLTPAVSPAVALLDHAHHSLPGPTRRRQPPTVRPSPVAISFAASIASSPSPTTRPHTSCDSLLQH